MNFPIFYISGTSCNIFWQFCSLDKLSKVGSFFKEHFWQSLLRNMLQMKLLRHRMLWKMLLLLLSSLNFWKSLMKVRWEYNAKFWIFFYTRLTFPIILETDIFLYTLLVCLCSINVKTDKPIRPKFCVWPHMTPGRVNETSKFEKNPAKWIFFLDAPNQRGKSAKNWKWFKMAEFHSNG